MSELQVVEHEVLVPLNVQDAERLDRRIRLMAQTTRENFEKVGRLLDEAKNGRVHEALGFKSWTAYVADALGGQLQLTGEARQAMVQVLAGEGMSVRAIATATGVSKSTVDRDIAQVSQNGTDADEGVPDSTVPQRDSSDPDATDATPAVPEEKVSTGLDGKTRRHKPRKPRVAKEPEPTPEPEPVVEPEPANTRKVQIPTALRAEVKMIGLTAGLLGSLTADPRWSKACDRFTDEDRTTFDTHIAALQAVRSAMDETGTATPDAPEEKTA